MPSTITLSQYQGAVLQRAGMENVPAGAAFISSSELIGYIDYGYQRLWNKLVRVLGENWARASANIPTVNGTSSYPLPDGTLYSAAPAFGTTLISVDVSLGGGLYVSGRAYTEEERNRYRTYPGWVWSSGWPVFYQLQGTAINFIPIPSGSYTVVLNYVPQFTPLAGANDVINAAIPAGLEEYIIWSAVADILAKEESDNSWAMQRLAQMDEMIEALGHSRQAAGDHRVRDVSGDLDPWGWSWR